MSNKHYAQQLYMAGGKTQKEIAALAGVSERTVYTWVHQFAWDKLRLATLQAPAIIADNICAQLVEIQNAIAQREPGKRFPDMQEAEITRKLIASLEKMKKYPSVSQHMQVLETFRNYIRPADKEFAKQLATYTAKFLSAKAVNGFAPYELEYGVSPVHPYYEEPQDTEAEHIPCPNINTCLHEDDCDYPKCLHTRKDPQQDPLTTHSIPAFQYYHPTPQLIDSNEYTCKLAEETGSIPAIANAEETGNFPPKSVTVTPIPTTSMQITSFSHAPFRHTTNFPHSPHNLKLVKQPEATGSNPAIATAPYWRKSF